MSINTSASFEFDLSLLESLHAEEEPWLDEVFVKPQGFEAFASPSSMIFSAPIGGGRTALRLQIAKELKQNRLRKILVVDWLPEAPQEEVTGNQLARFSMQQLIQVYTRALLLNLGENPESLRQAPLWALQGAAFFFNNYLTIEPHFYIYGMAATFPQAGIDALTSVIDLPYPKIIKPEATTQDIHRVMMLNLSAFGFSGMWVLVDQIEKWIAGEREQSFNMLGTMLDTLNYFENKNIIFKVFIPSEYAPLYFALGGVDRFRLLPQNLEYSQADLIKIIERRLAALTKKETFKIKNLCPDPDFIKWLANTGGKTPRRWLYLIKPFIQEYLAVNQGRQKPVELTPRQWPEIRDKFPQRLRFDQSKKKVFRGEIELKLTPGEFSILSYLYGTMGRVCTREELYYKVHRGLAAIPGDAQDPGYETTWRTNVDNIILRLRKAIEPDSNKPVYLVTERGAGIRLENAW